MLRASVLMLILSLHAPAFAESSAPQAAPQPLKGGQGYLVLDLLLEQRVSKIIFSRNGEDKLFLGPYEKGRHLLLVPAGWGELRLDRVTSPSYNLPFIQSYAEFDRLRLRIQPRRTNYFGQIIVGDIRSSYGFEIYVRNRLAYSYGELMEKYGPVLAQYPIHYAGKMTDHFYNEFLNPEPRQADE